MKHVYNCAPCLATRTDCSYGRLCIYGNLRLAPWRAECYLVVYGWSTASQGCLTTRTFCKTRGFHGWSWFVCDGIFPQGVMKQMSVPCCLLFCMGVKLGISHNTGSGHSRKGCWERYLGGPERRFEKCCTYEVEEEWT